MDGSTSTTYAPTDTTFDFFVTFEIYFGANYFASAHATAASLLALAASTIAFTQWVKNGQIIPNSQPPEQAVPNDTMYIIFI